MTRSNGNIITVKNVHINGVKRTNNALLTDAVKDVFGVMTLGQLRGIANAAKAKLALLGVFSEVELVLDRDGPCPARAPAAPTWHAGRPATFSWPTRGACSSPPR